MEEDIKILENFKNNKLEIDKLTLNCTGGFKIGAIYKKTELDPAIEHLLKERKEDKAELEKKDNIIDEMAKDYSKYQTLKSYPNEITETAFGIKDRILKNLNKTILKKESEDK